MSKNVDGAPIIKLFGQPLHEPLASGRIVATVSMNQLFPLRSLRLFDEREKLACVESERGVELAPILRPSAELARPIVTRGNQLAANLVL